MCLILFHTLYTVHFSSKLSLFTSSPPGSGRNKLLQAVNHFDGIPTQNSSTHLHARKFIILKAAPRVIWIRKTFYNMRKGIFPPPPPKIFIKLRKREEEKLKQLSSVVNQSQKQDFEQQTRRGKGEVCYQFSGRTNFTIVIRARLDDKQVVRFRSVKLWFSFRWWAYHSLASVCGFN